MKYKTHNHAYAESSKRESPVLKYLFSVRHGTAEKDGHLSEAGREEMEKLGYVTKDIIGNQKSVKILSSPVDRAYESAEILSTILSTKRIIKKCDCLSPPDLTKYYVLDPTEIHGIGSSILDDWTKMDSRHGIENEILPKIYKQVSKQHAEAIILVTHSPITEHYPAYLTEQLCDHEPYLEICVDFAWNGLRHGEAFFLDFSSNEWKKLPSGRTCCKFKKARKK